LCVSVVEAAFINGVERFDGLVRDSLTWEEYIDPFQRPLITQNDALTISVPDPFAIATWADVTTRTLTVGVGGMVRVDVRANDVPVATTELFLALTTNSRGSQAKTVLDSAGARVRIRIAPSVVFPPFDCGSFASGAFRGVFFGEAKPIRPQEYYTLQLERLTPSSVRCSAWETDSSLALGSTTFDVPGLPENLYISFGDDISFEGFSVSFDNVAIPEPDRTAAIFAATLLYRFWARRRRCEQV
jgi:hypothetical protein